jgi:5-methyltetrahydropteroyltriglutamate--homocysteine methyltransferase
MPRIGRPPYRAEHIGSLLRPRALKSAFGDFQAGRIDRAELDARLDAAIVEAIRLQENCGMLAITDGEFRRGSWFLGFVEAVEGLTTQPATFAFSGDHAAWECPYAEGRLRHARPITVHEYAFVRQHTDCTPKITMPAPSAMHFWRGKDSADPAVYPDLDQFFEDLIAVYRAEIAALAAAGCTYLQLDEVAIAMLCDPKVQQAVRARGDDPAELLERYIDVTNRALEGRPADMTVGMHLCRGNYKGQWMAEGSYAPVAERLFQAAAVDAFFLEYDTDRAGDFTPLQAMPADKTVVLGLVSTKTPQLESIDEIKRRIGLASDFVPLERLALSPQCGFASSVGGNPLTIDDEMRKLSLVAEVADAVWG